MSHLSGKGSRISLFVGGPVGIVLLVLFWGGLILAPELMSGEGLASICIYLFCKDPALAMLGGFLLSLAYTGKVAESALRKGKNLLFTSFIYSSLTNLIAWGVFGYAAYIENSTHFEIGFLLVPLILGGVASVLSTFTVGFWICYLIQRRIQAEISDDAETTLVVGKSE